MQSGQTELKSDNGQYHFEKVYRCVGKSDSQQPLAMYHKIFSCVVSFLLSLLYSLYYSEV